MMEVILYMLWAGPKGVLDLLTAGVLLAFPFILIHEGIVRLCALLNRDKQ